VLGELVPVDDVPEGAEPELPGDVVVPPELGAPVPSGLRPVPGARVESVALPGAVGGLVLVVPGVGMSGLVAPGVVMPGLVVPGLVVPGLVVPGLAVPGLVALPVALPGALAPEPTPACATRRQPANALAADVECDAG
jgi:hypothetical protein